MNQVPGIISEVISEGHLSIVKIDAAGSHFKAIVIDTPQTAPWLSVGYKVDMLFKENEVAIAKLFSGGISIQNRFESTIVVIDMGKLLCKVTLSFNECNIVSVITASAAQQLGLAIGDGVTAMVKTNEISLSPHD